jgi:YVTN family beta-propeller protein
MRYSMRALAARISVLSWFVACSSADVPGENTPNPGVPSNEAGVDPVAPRGRSGPLTQPSRGSSISIDEDDHRLVVANNDVGTASVFAIDYAPGGLPTLTKTAEIDVGEEPSSVIIHPNTLSAFVLARKAQKLVRIDDLQTTPKKGQEVAVGSEPTSFALEPSGKTIWVANSVDGTVMGIDTATMAVTTTIDLNAAIAASGLLGAYPGRVAMAHPRAIAITNSGDDVDVDESLWVADFYAYQKQPIDATNSNADVAKVGVIYHIPLSTKQPKVVEIPAKSDMGFHDLNDGVAGCYPNQLSSFVIQGGFGYVTSVCASPRGPTNLTIKAVGPTKTGAATCAADADCHGGGAGVCVATKCTTNCTADTDCGYRGKCSANLCEPNPANVRTTLASAVSVIDLGAEKTFDTVILSKEFDTYYSGLGTPDDASRRLPLNPLDIGFVPDSMTAYLPASGADAVFRVDFDATYTTDTINSVGDPKNPFINLSPNIVDVGRVPTGIAVAHKARTEGSPRRFAYVANWATRNVSAVDLENQDLAGLKEGAPPVVAKSSAMPTGDALAAHEGKRLFYTGLGRWSYKGQGWMACVDCHSDGLSDNVNWQLSSARQAPTLEATYNKKNPNDFRINLWSGGFDEVSDHESAIRNIAGGVGSIVKNTALELSSRLDVPALTADGGVPPQTGLNGSSMALADPSNPIGLAAGSVLDDWKNIAAYVRTIRSPRAPSNLDAQKVAQGEALFKEGKCQGCHGGDTWTIARVFYTPTFTPKDATPDNPGLSTMLSRKSWRDDAMAAGFPSTLFPAITPERQTMRANTAINPVPLPPLAATAPASPILCALRPVGTYNVAEPEVGVFEKTTTGADAPGNNPDVNGFNVPSILGMSLGAPYFHGGQARTLEATFDERFAGHFRALNPAFLSASDPARAEKVQALIQYLLSIDNDKPTVAVPPLGPEGGVLCKAP